MSLLTHTSRLAGSMKLYVRPLPYQHIQRYYVIYFGADTNVKTGSGSFNLYNGRSGIHDDFNLHRCGFTVKRLVITKTMSLSWFCRRTLLSLVSTLYTWDLENTFHRTAGNRKRRTFEGCRIGVQQGQGHYCNY